jgi:hypothetical protein
MTTWRKLISVELESQGETWADVETMTLTQPELVVQFDSGYGGEEGEPFTMWTKNRVYFPCCYDGAEWCGSVSRHPDGKPTNHIGG